MKLLHTADLHLGQVIYQNYDRADEHRHFFVQLARWCQEEKPDALIVSGDIFNIQQPSAQTKKLFTDSFAELHQAYPKMKIVMIAGNHDSASRIQADKAVWKCANSELMGIAPANGMGEEGWQDNYIVPLDSGYIVALPYMNNIKKELLKSVMDRVAERNIEGKPVVLMAHLAVTGTDLTGHDSEIGTIQTQDVASLGGGFDYCALGHIHKPQTLDHREDCLTMEERIYPAGVVRYSGSALHVSADEKYPHTVTVVTVGEHGGEVRIRQLRIDELRHFHELPEAVESCFHSSDEAIEGIKAFAEEHPSGYFRLRLDYNADLPTNFNNMVYDTISLYNDEIRFNPQHIWVGKPEVHEDNLSRPVFEVSDLQEMKDPLEFIVKTIDNFPGLDLEEVKSAFAEVADEVKRLADEDKKPSKENKKSKSSKENSQTA